MNGVIIPGMEIPKNCGACPIANCRFDNGWANYPDRPGDCPLIPYEDSVESVEVNVFDEEEVYTDCTVQVLRNSVTGDVSVGWWRNSGGRAE